MSSKPAKQISNAICKKAWKEQDIKQHYLQSLIAFSKKACDTMTFHIVMRVSWHASGHDSAFQNTL